MTWLFAIVIIIFLLGVVGHYASGADWGNPLVNIIDGLLRLLCRYYHRFQYQPLSIPEQGAALIAGNHLSGLDPLLIIAAARRPIRFLIAREEYERFGLQWLFRAVKCIPVERSGRAEMAFREALGALEQGDVVALFPEGAIHTSDKPPRKLKAGVYKLAVKTRLPIHPVRIKDIRGEGHTLAALLIPSQASLYTYPAIDVKNLTQEQCLHNLQRYFRDTD